MLDVLMLLAADPAAPTPGSSWLTPAGLDLLLTVLIPLALVVGRLLGRAAQAKKIADLLVVAKSYTATVRGVQSFRDLATPAEANKLIGFIETATAAEGVAEAHHAATHAITEGAAPMPVTAPGAVVEKIATSDPVVAVRAVTTRLTPRRVA